MVVAEKLREMKLDVDVWEPTGEELFGHKFFCSTRSDFVGSPNVVGVLKGAGGGKSMILNAHIDVVPEGEAARWDDDPYSGAVRGGKLYGRGTSDMKGGAVANLIAMQAIQGVGLRLKGDVIFQSVIEEESGGAGTLAAILRGYKADAALIPEPTNMKIFPKQQGSMWFRITVTGRIAHGGTRYEGVSAIEKSMAVVQHVLNLEAKRNIDISDPLYQGNPIPVPINLGTIEGGSWPSSVPDVVKLEGRMGVFPEEEMEDAQQEMIRWLEALKEQDPWFVENPVKLEFFGARWLPGFIDAEHELLRIVKDGFKTVMNKEPVVEASPWGTDGGLLTKLSGTPCIIFGPGVTETAHFPNEHIELDDMFKTAEIIALAVVNWCEIDTV